MPAPYVRYTPNYDWRNKHQNVRRRAARLYSVWNLWEPGSPAAGQDWRAGLAGLQMVIREAEALGRRIRPLGGSWSLSEVAATNDFLVDTKGLNARTIGFSPERLVPSAREKAARLVYAQCGSSILELNQALEARGLSLKTSGASNGQTIAGAIATGTHGSANWIGSLQDTVVALHILGEGGENIWIERESEPIANDGYLDMLGVTRPLRDDDMFRAALVGVGGFGIVHAVVFEAEPIYLLECTIRRFDVDQIRTALRSLDVGGLGLPDGDAVPFHFETVINPYATDAGDRGAYVRVMYKRDFAPVAANAAGGVVRAWGDDLLGAIGLLGDPIPEIYPVALGHLIDSQLEPVERALGTHGQTFGSTTIRGAGMSLELGVPIDRAEDALDTLLSVAKTYLFGALFAFRYVPPTEARLGFTRFSSQTCTIEIPANLSGRSSEAYERIIAAMDASQIPYTMHWGQCLPVGYTAAHVQNVYGDDADAYRTARRLLLPTETGRWRFSNDVLERFGLSV